MKPLIKPQYVDQIPRALAKSAAEATVKELLEGKSERGQAALDLLLDELELREVLGRKPDQLSGGELQRFAIAMTCCQKADMCVYLISFLHES